MSCSLARFRPPFPSVLIQVAVVSAFATPLVAQTEYTTDGTPTAAEEQIRWLMNRGRYDTAAENQAQGSAYTGLPANAGPLAPHHALTLACRHHSEDMARQNTFQHDTIPGSAYYDTATQPRPWDRMRAEGYSYNRAAENIAAGYGSPTSAYVGWWHSSGHRANMYNAQLREVGDGYFYEAGSRYGGYYTMDLGSSGQTHFFTGTTFNDLNQNTDYDEGEGIGEVRIRLRVGETFLDAFDKSSTVGSFAVPIQSVADGTTVEVLLANVGTSAVSLDIPQSYSRCNTVTLGVAEEVLLGSFTQPDSARNVGFRDLVQPSTPPSPPVVDLRIVGDSIQLRWSSQPDLEYLPQWTEDLAAWHDLSPAYIVGTGSDLTRTDPGLISGAGLRAYRLVVRRP